MYLAAKVTLSRGREGAALSESIRDEGLPGIIVVAKMAKLEILYVVPFLYTGQNKHICITCFLLFA